MSFIRTLPLTCAVVAALTLAPTASAGEAPATPVDAPAPSPYTTTAATAGFSLPWWSVDGGGGTSSGGVFSVTGTIGQPDVGTSAGHGQVADAGLWSGNRVTIFVDDLELGGTGRWSVVVP